jgi:uncharacterized membrane protein
LEGPVVAQEHCMATHEIRTQERDSLARFLGWFSIGLGTAQVVAPRALCKLVGGGDARLMRLMGLRELGHGAGILTRPRPTGFVWSRVAGDALDLGLLGLVARHGNKRTLFAIANVLPVAAADVFEAKHLSQKQGAAQSGKRIRKSVTIAKPREQVEHAWAQATDLREKVDAHGATVDIAAAPGDRGTELAVEFVHDPPAGDFGVAFEKVTGRDLATQLADDLRRFKALVETGEVVRSDSTPSGHLLAEHLKQRAAQPLEEEVKA